MNKTIFIILFSISNLLGQIEIVINLETKKSIFIYGEKITTSYTYDGKTKADTRDVFYKNDNGNITISLVMYDRDGNFWSASIYNFMKSDLTYIISDYLESNDFIAMYGEKTYSISFGHKINFKYDYYNGLSDEPSKEEFGTFSFETYDKAVSDRITSELKLVQE